MDFKAPDFRHMVFPVILLLLAGTKQVAGSAGYVTDNEGRAPCFPEEFFNQVRCCDQIDHLQDSLEHSRESVEELHKRLGDVTSFTQDAIANVSAQSFQLSSKLSESYRSFITGSLNNYAERQRNTEEQVDRLTSESNSLAAFTQQVQQRLDDVFEDLKQTRDGRKECLEVSDTGLVETYSSLAKDINVTDDNVEVLEESLKELKTEVSAVGTKLASAEADLQRLDTLVKNLCLPPFSWQGDGCYFLPYAKKTWQESRDYCIALGADLVVPRDYQQFIGWFGTLNLDDDLWIGASDRDEEGNWVWVNGKPLDIDPAEFFNWKQSTAEDEDCIEICPHTQNRPTDYECEHENFFLCQKSIEVALP